MGSDVYAAMWGTGGQFSVNGAMRGQEFEVRLAEIRTPTHVVHGRHDYIPPAIGEAIQRGIPGSRLAIMEESAHLPMHDEPMDISRSSKGSSRRSSMPARCDRECT